MSYADENEKVITKEKDFPAFQHFAAIEFCDFYFSDDGYGESGSVDITKYIYFKDRAAMETYVRNKELSESSFSSKVKYKIIEVAPLQVQKSVTVSANTY